MLQISIASFDIHGWPDSWNDFKMCEEGHGKGNRPS